MHRSRTPTHLAAISRRTATALALSTLTACAETLRPLGSTPAAAESNADQLFEAFVARFSPTGLSPKYDIARVKMAQAALIPSRVFNDTSVWSAPATATTRALHISGTLEPQGRYRLEIRPSLTPAAKPGDSRHTIDLEQLASNAYRWNTDVALAIGNASAEGISNLISSLLRAPEGKTEKEIRDDYHLAFPRAQVAFGRGFSIDSLHISPGAVGTTSVAITLGFRPEVMRPVYPALAGYLDKYLGPARYHFALSDRSGVALLDIVGRDRQFTIHYRLQQGALTSLFGPPRPWGDTLQLLSDATTKVKLFRVGFHEMLTTFEISNTGHERSWTMVAQHEPKWDLPFVTERLLRSPLRRPFEGAGSMFRLMVRDSAGAQSTLSRHTRLEVQESAIMKFIGGLVSHALGDLDAKVEAEEDRFLHDGFEALQADLKALGPVWRRSGED